MKKFTRTLSLALAGVLVFGLAACNTTDETEETTGATTSVEATTGDAEETEETTEDAEETEETTEDAELDLTAHSEVQEAYLVELPDGSSLNVNMYMGKKDGAEAFLGVDYVEHTANDGVVAIITSNTENSGLSLEEIHANSADEEEEKVEYESGDTIVDAYSFTLSETQRSVEIVVEANVDGTGIVEFSYILGEDA